MSPLGFAKVGWQGGSGFKAIEATGGTTRTYTEGDVQYKSHTFTGDGTFAVTSTGSEGLLEIMVLAGGGSGGGGGDNANNDGGGGGGAGGMLVETATLTATGSGYTSISNSSGGDEGGTDNMYFNGGANTYVTTLKIDAEL